MLLCAPLFCHARILAAGNGIFQTCYDHITICLQSGPNPAAYLPQFMAHLVHVKASEIDFDHNLSSINASLSPLFSQILAYLLQVVAWDKSEFDQEGRWSPEKVAEARGVRERSRADNVLERRGVKVSNRFLASNRRAPPLTDGMVHTGVVAKPCSIVYSPALGGMQAEPFWGTQSKMEKASRQVKFTFRIDHTAYSHD